MFNLQIEKAIEKIKKEKAKTVIIQLPDGLKPKAKEIKEKLEKETGAEILLWGGSCFGACDVPRLNSSDSSNSIKADLLIQFGHSEWKNA